MEKMVEYDNEKDRLREKNDFEKEMQRKKQDEVEREKKLREVYDYRKRTGAIEFPYESFEKWKRRFKL